MEEAVFYVKSRHFIEGEQSARDKYNSSMLWMIAQPTRKEPEKLPSFDQTMEANRTHDKKNAKEIMGELMERLK